MADSISGGKFAFISCCVRLRVGYPSLSGVTSEAGFAHDNTPLCHFFVLPTGSSKASRAPVSTADDNEKESRVPLQQRVLGTQLRSGWPVR